MGHIRAYLGLGQSLLLENSLHSFSCLDPQEFFCWLCTRLKTGLEATSVLDGKLGQDSESLPSNPLSTVCKSTPLAKGEEQGGKGSANLQICKRGF